MPFTPPWFQGKAAAARLGAGMLTDRTREDCRVRGLCCFNAGTVGAYRRGDPPPAAPDYVRLPLATLRAFALSTRWRADSRGVRSDILTNSGFRSVVRRSKSRSPTARAGQGSRTRLIGRERAITAPLRGIASAGCQHRRAFGLCSSIRPLPHTHACGHGIHRGSRTGRAPCRRLAAGACIARDNCRRDRERRRSTGVLCPRRLSQHFANCSQARLLLIFDELSRFPVSSRDGLPSALKPPDHHHGQWPDHRCRTEGAVAASRSGTIRSLTAQPMASSFSTHTIRAPLPGIWDRHVDSYRDEDLFGRAASGSEVEGRCMRCAARATSSIAISGGSGLN